MKNSVAVAARWKLKFEVSLPRIAEQEEIAELVREVQSERSMGKAVELQKRLKADASNQVKEAQSSRQSRVRSNLHSGKAKVGLWVFVLTVNKWVKSLRLAVLKRRFRLAC